MTKLAVFSYKNCWLSDTSPTGYATDGGFPFQMSHLSQLFDATTLVIPCVPGAHQVGEVPLTGHRLTVRPLTALSGSGILRKLRFLGWALRNSPALLSEVWRADAVHAPVPGDIGTIGMLLAILFRKPLFVRHCGNWLAPVTTAEHFWKWLMERFAGGQNVMLATGGTARPPSKSNPNIRWIFATSLSDQEIESCRIKRDLPSKGRVRLVIACRQDREKGTGVVIESLPLILKSFPNATLSVLGDGDALAEFRSRASELGLTQRIEFHGKVDHQRVLEVLHQSDLFCYPTAASEGFPKAVLEALACGLPVITSRVSVLPNLISTGCGILLDEVTPTTVAHAVVQALANAETYCTMSNLAMKTASEYSLERWRDTIADLLHAAWGRYVTVRVRLAQADAKN
jgi:glycosyltransferase involved in cell wall biosynthesis